MRIKVKTVWRTQKDGDVCAQCKALDGYTWTFEADGPHPKQLIHPLYGPVFDMRPAADGSLIKEMKGHRCRCMLEHQIEVCGDDEIEPEQEQQAAELV